VTRKLSVSLLRFRAPLRNNAKYSVRGVIANCVDGIADTYLVSDAGMTGLRPGIPCRRQHCKAFAKRMCRSHGMVNDDVPTGYSFSTPVGSHFDVHRLAGLHTRAETRYSEVNEQTDDTHSAWPAVTFSTSLPMLLSHSCRQKRVLTTLRSTSGPCLAAHMCHVCTDIIEQGATTCALS
jgi:hypothetical protein